jgi:hypothetical protein
MDVRIYRSQMGNVVRAAATRLYDDPIGSELAQSRADIAGRRTQPAGDLVGRKAIGTTAQDLENAIRELRHLDFLNASARLDRLTNRHHVQRGRAASPQAVWRRAHPTPDSRQ